MQLLDDPGFLSETIGAIYDCTLRPEAWPELLARLCESCGAIRGVLGVSAAGGSQVTIAALHGAEWTEADERSIAINPFLPLALVYPIDRALVASRDYGMEA